MIRILQGLVIMGVIITGTFGVLSVAQESSCQPAYTAGCAEHIKAGTHKDASGHLQVPCAKYQASCGGPAALEALIQQNTSK